MEKHEHEVSGEDGQLPVVRMMVLETDEPHHETQSRRGTFGEILHHHFADAGRAHDPPLGIETDRRFVVTENGGTMPKVSDFQDCHALLITGSMYDAHGDNPWILELLDLLKSERERQTTFSSSLPNPPSTPPSPFSFLISDFLGSL